LSRPRAGAVRDHGDNCADRRDVASRHADFSEHAGRGRRHFHRNLVGFDLDQDLVERHRLAGLFLPLQKRRFRHRFRQLRNLDFDHCHLVACLVVRVSLIW